MKKMYYLCLGLVLITVSCKKDKESSGPADPHTGIYAVGYKVNPTSPFLLPVPAYWAEGKETVLGDNKAYAMSVVLNGDDVYIAGHINGKPVVWKNGVPGYLPLDGADGAATTVSFYAGDTYVTGTDDGLLTVWKNGVHYKKLSHSGEYKSMVADKGNIHYLLRKYKAGNSVTEYWKNEVMTEVLPYNMQLLQVAVSGDDVYFAGTNEKETQLAIWKNNVHSVIETTTDTVYTKFQFSNICIDGTDVYVFYYKVNNLDRTAQVKYWKNGTVYELKTPDHFDPAYFKVFGGKIYYTGVFFNDAGTGNGSRALYIVDDVIHYLTKEVDCGVVDIAVRL